MCRRRRRRGACKPRWCVRHRPQRRRFGHAAQQPRSWAHATRAPPLRGVSCSRSAGHFFPRRLCGAADAGFAAAACAEQGCSTCGATGANGRRVDPLVLRRAPSSLAPDSARQLGRWQELPHGAVFERPVPAVSGERAPRASWGSSCSAESSLDPALLPSRRVVAAPNRQMATIAVDFGKKTVAVNEAAVELQIWCVRRWRHFRAALVLRARPTAHAAESNALLEGIHVEPSVTAAASRRCTTEVRVYRAVDFVQRTLTRALHAAWMKAPPPQSSSTISRPVNHLRAPKPGCVSIDNNRRRGAYATLNTDARAARTRRVGGHVRTRREQGRHGMQATSDR